MTICDKVTEFVKDSSKTSPVKAQNTRCYRKNGIVEVWLYQTCLFRMDENDGSYWFNNGGYSTPTTLARLNAILDGLQYNNNCSVKYGTFSFAKGLIRFCPFTGEPIDLTKNISKYSNLSKQFSDYLGAYGYIFATQDDLKR